MNLEEIRQLAREWLDDTVNPGYLWSNERLNAYANEAQREAAIRARLLVDSATADVVTIAVTAGQASYPLHSSIIVVRRIEWRGAQDGDKPYALRRTSFDQLDRECPYWRSRSASQPCSIVQDLDQHILTLSATPTVDATLNQVVWRYPLATEKMVNDDDEPVLREEFHEDLAHWICHRAFGHKDSELNDEEGSAQHLGLFEEKFGPKPSAAQLRRLATDHDTHSDSHFF